MQLICNKCFSADLIEKSSESIHQKAVYCANCNSWVKWGGIESNEVPDGEYLAEVISGEEKNDKFIFFLVETESKKKIKHFIWKRKDSNKYNSIALNSMLAGFDSNISKFTTVNEIIEFVINKNVYITVKRKDYKGKQIPEIIKWRVCKKQ